MNDREFSLEDVRKPEEALTPAGMLLAERPASIEILGCRVDAYSAEGAAETILAAVEEAAAGSVRPAQVVTIGTEMVMRARKDRRFRSIVNDAPFSLCDTIGVLLASKMRGGPIRERVVGVDLIERLCGKAAERGVSVYFLGSNGDAALAAATKLALRFPGLRVAGARHGYFSPAESAQVAADICASEARLLFVALGSPKQEYWIAEHLRDTGCGAAVGVGGAFDVLSGRARRAPKLFQVSGLEWLYRLLAEPQRWRRQLVLPHFVVTAAFETVTSTVYRRKRSV